MEKLIMVALKFKANLRSSMSGLLTSSAEWCGLMATEESCWRRKGKGGVAAWKFLFAELGDRFLYSPMPGICWLRK